jgi:hypothetical protein
MPMVVVATAEWPKQGAKLLEKEKKIGGSHWSKYCELERD